MEWYKRKRKVKKIKGKKWGIVQFFFFKGGKIEGEKKGKKEKERRDGEKEKEKEGRRGEEGRERKKMEEKEEEDNDIK